MEGDQPKKVTIGDTVKIKFENGEIKTYTVVGSDKTDPANGFISYLCPVGEVVIGETEGVKKKYMVGGRESELEIVEILKK